jgi:hypothetical protein
MLEVAISHREVAMATLAASRPSNGCRTRFVQAAGLRALLETPSQQQEAHESTMPFNRREAV